MHTYEAKIISVSSGDTVTAIIDLGFSITTVQDIRLARISPRDDASPWLRSKLSNRSVTLVTEKQNGYIADIILGTKNMNDAIVDAGHAEYLP